MTRFPAVPLGEEDAASDVNWLVGCVERADEIYFSATKIDIHRNEDAAARASITKAILAELGLLPRAGAVSKR